MPESTASLPTHLLVGGGRSPLWGSDEQRRRGERCWMEALGGRCFHFSEVGPRSGLAGSHAECGFNFLRNL